MKALVQMMNDELVLVTDSDPDGRFWLLSWNRKAGTVGAIGPRRTTEEVDLIFVDRYERMAAADILGPTSPFVVLIPDTGIDETYSSWMYRVRNSVEESIREYISVTR